MEIPGVMSQSQLAGNDPLDDPVPAGPGLERAFRRRVWQLPPVAQRALLVAAASESPALAVIAKALKALGDDIVDLEPAEAAGLISIDWPELEFRHPLLRSAVYHGATSTDRRATHRALADA